MSNNINYLIELPKFFNYISSIESRNSRRHVELFIFTSEYDDCRYNLSNDIMKEFIEILQNFIKNTLQENGNVKYHDFYDLNFEKDSIRYISTTEVPNLNEIIDPIYHHESVPTCKDIKEMNKNKNKILAYAIDIQDNEYGKIIYFKKKEQVKVLKHKAILTQGVLNKIVEDVLEFDEKVDFIFVEKLNSIIIFNEENFEIIFRFRNFYLKNSSESLNKLDGTYVSINQNILIEIEKLNIPLLKNIVKLEKNHKFEQIKNNQITIDYFKDQQKIIQKQIPNTDKLKFDIKDNKITINEKKELKGFIDACNDTYLRSLARKNLNAEPDLYEAPEKNLLK
jgi:hypothetical protein